MHCHVKLQIAGRPDQKLETAVTLDKAATLEYGELKGVVFGSDLLPTRGRFSQCCNPMRDAALQESCSPEARMVL